MTNPGSANTTALPKIPTWLDLGMYLALSLTVGTSWLGVLALCFGRIS